MLAVHVAVLYFVFLISMCVTLVVVTAVGHYLHLRGVRKPFEVMPTCVSSVRCKFKILSQQIYSRCNICLFIRNLLTDL